MFSRILFPTDFSECANKVLEYLEDFKKAGLEEVILVRVINLNRVTGVSSGFDIESWIRDEEEKSEKMLQELVELLKKREIKARYVSPIPVGDPVTEIIKVAEKEKFSLILMGSRGKGILKEILLGSVSEGVVRRATTPVLIVKSKVVKMGRSVECELIAGRLFEKILYAHDLSKYSDEVLDYVRQAALAGGKEVVIVHVVENKRKKDGSDAEKKLDEVKRELEKDGVNVKVVIKSGTPYKEIINTAKEENATLIMMGSRGLGFVEGMLLGSTTDAVVRHSKIPVFVYKGKD
jgi:nucleotide-binding universal stress UspA family protein